MTAIRIVVDDRAIRTFLNKSIALGDGRALLELKRGLSDGGNKVRTKVRHALKEQTGVVKYASVVSRVTSYKSGLTYVITTTGKGLPIKEFKWSVPGNVKAMPWNVSHLFARSFQTKVRGLLLARTTSKRFPIRALYGPSLPKELVKDQSLEAFQQGVKIDVQIAVAARVAKLMP